jgi:hypothetical protein
MLLFKDKFGNLTHSLTAISEEMTGLASQLDDVRLILFHAENDSVVLACLGELLDQEDRWSWGRADENLTKGVMAAIIQRGI